ncbi:MAG: hypothetical protein LHV68_09895 [Elusimicrobia bacterium]|nr:hypothetical protein [Candidatus Liberimonas magnetica]
MNGEERNNIITHLENCDTFDGFVIKDEKCRQYFVCAITLLSRQNGNTFLQKLRSLGCKSYKRKIENEEVDNDADSKTDGQ